MQLLRADTDLSAKTKFLTICEAGRSIDINAGSIDLPEEALGVLVISRHDTFAVACVVAIDMRDGFVERIDGFDGKDVIKVFCAPVGFGRRRVVLEVGAGTLIRPKLYLLFIKLFSKAGNSALATSRCTTRDSSALQTDTRCVFALKMMFTAISISAEAST